MSETLAIILAALIGSGLPIIDKWVRVRPEQKRKRQKSLIWKTMADIEEKCREDGTLDFEIGFRREDLAKYTKIDLKKLEPLVYEMIEEGMIKEMLSGIFSRCKGKPDFKPYGD